jgi:hypothetical protein
MDKPKTKPARQRKRRAPPRSKRKASNLRVLTGDVSEQRWCVSHRADPAAARLADRHYNRKKIGSRQFAPTGSCAVFLTDCGRAFWITSAPLAVWVKHAWAGAWICSAFRQEGAGVASQLIRQAVAATIAHYGAPPALGMVTFIDRNKVRPIMVRGKPVWGWTYLKAGFVDAGETKGGLLALQLWPEAMPGPHAANQRTMHGTSLFDRFLFREAAE